MVFVGEKKHREIQKKLYPACVCIIYVRSAMQPLLAIYFFNFIIHFSPFFAEVSMQPYARLNQRLRVNTRLTPRLNVRVLPPLSFPLSPQHFWLSNIFSRSKNCRKNCFFCAEKPFFYPVQFMSNLNFFSLLTAMPPSLVRRCPSFTHRKNHHPPDIQIVSPALFLSCARDVRTLPSSAVCEEAAFCGVAQQKLCTIFFMLHAWCLFAINEFLFSSINNIASTHTKISASGGLENNMKCFFCSPRKCDGGGGDG